MAVFAAPLKLRPRSLMAYVAFLPAAGAAALVGRQFAASAICAVVALLGYCTLRVIEADRIAGFEQQVRTSALGSLRVGDSGRVEQLFRALPPPAKGAGYLYAIRFATGVVKVGQTTDLRTRLNKHRRDAEAIGVGVIDLWVSQPHTNFVRTEQGLLDSCGLVARRDKREYFRALSCERVAAIAASLPMKVVAT